MRSSHRSGTRQSASGDAIPFFWDRLEPRPHDVDVKALLRIAVVYNVRLPATARRHFLLSSPLMERGYERRLRKGADVAHQFEVG
jgi:methylglyoxal synthase